MNKLTLLLVAAIFLSAAAFASSIPQLSAAQQTAPNNTRNNKEDAQKGAVTADRETTRKIRASIMSDKSLSPYAHNVKVITQDGKVTRKGPVRTDRERVGVEAKATAVAGDGNVTSGIQVAPPKS